MRITRTDLFAIREFLKIHFPPLLKIAEFFRYIFFLRQIHIAEREDKLHPIDDNGIAIPPARLRYRVHGALDRDSFLLVGQKVATDIKSLLQIVGRDISYFSNILDFGCGSARVMRHLIGGRAHQFTGTDVDPEVIQWCQKSIIGVNWHNNEYLPPTQYSNNSFDLIYAISVFTHLDEKYQTAWLNELYRIASVGAILIFTVHGEPIIETASLTPEQQAKLEKVGFLYVSGTTGKFKLDGLPDFYQTSYHTQNYIERIWGSLFEIVAQVPRGIGAHQNAIILRKN